MDIRQRTRDYFAALEQSATGDALADFYDPEVIQEEFPNRLIPTGARRDLAAILAAAERGQQFVTHQQYEILSIIVDGNRTAVEFIWSGRLVVPVGPLSAGDVMRGRFASFLEFRGDRILTQRSYDCFDP